MSLRDRLTGKGPAGSGGGQKPPEGPKSAFQKTPALAPESIIPQTAALPQRVAVLPDEGAYAQERAEQAAFESTSHTIRKDTVLRISFGQILTSETPQNGPVATTESDSDCEHAGGHIWDLGQRAKGTRGSLTLAATDGTSVDATGGDHIFQQLQVAVPDLQSLSIPPGEGPYADKDGVVARFADAVFADMPSEELIRLIERVIDTRVFMGPEFEVQCPRMHQSGYNFSFAPDLVTSDALPTAGQVLSEQGRVYTQSASGASFIELVHPMESYLLAISALRSRGLAAYPARAVMPSVGNEEIYAPLIAIVDLTKEVPLTTFDLFRAHPPMASVDIISDVAMMGVLHALRAETRVNHLSYEMLAQGQQGRVLDDETISTQLYRISRSLFECIKAWPGCQFVGMALSRAYQNLIETFIRIDPNMAQPNPRAMVFSGVGQSRMRTLAEITADSYVKHIETQLDQMLSKAKPE